MGLMSDLVLGVLKAKFYLGVAKEGAEDILQAIDVPGKIENLGNAIKGKAEDAKEARKWKDFWAENEKDK